PEFGRQPGGQIQIATRSGTNDFHGTLFDYARNDVFDANDWFNNARGLRKPATRQHDFGGVIGGPVRRDRTFFFFSYEGLRLRQPQALTSTVPTVESRQNAPASLQPFLSVYPLPNGPVKFNPVTGLPNGYAEFNASVSVPSNLDSIGI